ncbi:reticulocyte-binding protein 1a, putative (macronuclear) [Tetrahymena thermophila SB210]|uniref:Reticulocyte-binding protein 1a, putative n=1 Tax=Tetrahymena thermophila (strain SB210) TaxID=312017 RepID=I7M6P9_TETTS|nr:reticulocyte-binding protein 1a, putative [Tetrahymena thermophila SB210]EAR85608.1 reticulocyte-binding protein 1a, putative [Tetrahymena thermophila SB210]|eukprot:XP_001033271.1 reticulocyte-binding protein 1a, putative [Tetrahymena thermophila SB210]
MNQQNNTQISNLELFKGTISASKEFYLENISRNSENYPSAHITLNDLEKNERKKKYKEAVKNIKKELDTLLKENTELYRQHNSKEFYIKKSEQLQEYIYCQEDMIKQINKLDKQEENIIQKCEDINENLQLIDSINNITKEQQNLKGVLNQIQRESEKSLYLLNKEKN